MDMNSFRVLAECSDARSGQRFGIGDTFDPAPTLAQATRLVAAGCLPQIAIAAAAAIEDGGGIDPAAIARAQLNHDGLFDKSMDELRQIVADEGIEPSEDEMKGHVIDVIRRQRTTKAAAQIPQENVQMRTEAGELAARQADVLAAGTSAAPPPVANAHGIGLDTDGGTNHDYVGEAVDDGLDAFTVERLRDVADTEKVEVASNARKADLVAAIRAHRAKA